MSKNLVLASYRRERNRLLKGLTYFFLGASAVLLFTYSDLIINPNVSSSLVYLQKMFFSPNGTSNMTPTITVDGTSGSIISTSLQTTTIQTTRLCDAAGTNCLLPADVITGGNLAARGFLTGSTVDALSGNFVTALSGLQAMILQLSGRLATLSGTVSLHLSGN